VEEKIRAAIINNKSRSVKLTINSIGGVERNFSWDL